MRYLKLWLRRLSGWEKQFDIPGTLPSPKHCAKLLELARAEIPA